MTRGKYYSVAMPIASLIYVIVGLIAHSGIVWTVGRCASGSLPSQGMPSAGHSRLAKENAAPNQGRRVDRSYFLK